MLWFLVFIFSCLGYYLLMHVYLVQESQLESGQVVGSIRQLEIIHSVLLLLFLMGAFLSLIMLAVKLVKMIIKTRNTE